MTLQRLRNPTDDASMTTAVIMAGPLDGMPPIEQMKIQGGDEN